MLTRSTASIHQPLHAQYRERIARRGWSRIDAALQRPCSYRHPAGRIRRVETHISVIYLAGRFAYKIKKPVDLGFVDFTDAAARQHDCNEEVRLNRRLAPKLYLGVVPVVRLGRTRKIGAQGTPVEHAVRMRRFDERDLFSHLLTRGELGAAQIGRVAERLAVFHRRASTPPPHSLLGTATFVRTQMATVLTSLEREAGSLVPAGVRQWCEREADRLAGHFEARRAGGFVRECHGDLHLDNIVRKGNDAVMFDCIEFSDALRWIDVASDLAFLLMDLRAHGRDDLASMLLNGWLQRTGDFGTLPVLRFYLVYRALVRALVEVLKARGSPATDGLARARNYVACATRIASAPQPYLLLCHGYSGSGKSVASEALANCIGAIRLSSDTERKRQRAFAPPDHHALPAVAYSRKAIDSHYDALLAIARQILEAGYPVLMDATFLKQRHRASFIELACVFDVPVFLLDFHTSARQLAERVRKRATDPGQSSDANAAVLVRQLANEEPLTPDEAALTVDFDTDVPLGAFQHAMYWKRLLIRLHPESPIDHAVRRDTLHWQTNGWDAVGCQSAV
jgi:aminoglycoside phosphotransferase family enzyme/predicted kinase